jgi:hypothetical protein
MYALRSMFRDNVKARQLNPDGSYTRRVAAAGEVTCRVQQSLQDEVKRIASLAREVAGVSFESAHREHQGQLNLDADSRPRPVSASGRKSGS